MSICQRKRHISTIYRCKANSRIQLVSAPAGWKGFTVDRDSILIPKLEHTWTHYINERALWTHELNRIELFIVHMFLGDPDRLNLDPSHTSQTKNISKTGISTNCQFQLFFAGCSCVCLIVCIRVNLHLSHVCVSHTKVLLLFTSFHPYVKRCQTVQVVQYFFTFSQTPKNSLCLNNSVP